MATKAELIEKLLKIKNLAEKGVIGEREAAKNLLEKIMEEHGITESDLIIEDKDMFWFRFNRAKNLDEKLLRQIIYSVMGECDSYSRGHKTGKDSVIGIECSKAQAIEIEAKHKFYFSALNKEIEIFFSAFVNKNDIFPPTEQPKPVSSVEDLIKLRKINSMKECMDFHSFHKQIT